MRPLRVEILTIPEEMSPYSADGTPVTTSIDSMDVEAMLRVLTPDISPSEAFVDRRTPSISTAVPKEAFPAFEPPSRSEKTLSFIRSAFTVLPPGRSVEISETLTICRWLMAFPSMVREVAMALVDSRAVTTTLSSFRLSSGAYRRSESVCARISTSVRVVTYPRQETEKRTFPPGTFLTEKLPSLSATAQSPASGSSTTA